MADNMHTGGADEELKSSLSKNLDDIFGLNDGPIELTKSVEDKRKTVSTQSKELQELEQRIKEAEERLRNAGSNPAPKANDAVPAAQHPSQNPPSRAPPNIPGRNVAQ